MKRFRRWLIGIGIFVLLAVGIALLVRANYDARVTARLNREFELLKQAGEPTDPCLLAPPLVPDDQNAALLYLEAADKFVEPNTIEYTAVYELTRASAADTGKYAATLQGLFEKNKEALALCLRGSELESCRFPQHDEWGYPVPRKQAHLTPPTLCRVLTARARLACLLGDVPAACVDCCAALRFAAHLRQEAALGIVQLLLDEVSLECAEFIVSSARLDDEHLRRILQALVFFKTPDRLARFLRFDRSLSVKSYNDYISGVSATQAAYAQPLEPDEIRMPTAAETALWARVLFLGDAVWKNDLGTYLALLREYIAVAEQPYFVALTKLAQLDSAVQELPEHCVLCKCVLPTFADWFRDHACFEARQDILMLGVAVLIYESRNGSLPASLADLIPDPLARLPVDPFTGDSYIYRKTKDGFMVYSVGENLKDDGGTPYDPSEGPGEGDISFRVPGR
ncbi:MAG: hypothetical protein RDV41_15800 [Planctomycetota bacterium]|nr:hypothetical protein [Planctomycetota bacterium]